MFSLDTIKKLTAAKMALNEIIRLQRLNARNVPWDIVLERYGSARNSLARCAEGVGIPEEQRKILADWIPQDLTKAFQARWTILRGRGFLQNRAET